MCSGRNGKRNGWYDLRLENRCQVLEACEIEGAGDRRAPGRKQQRVYVAEVQSLLRNGMP